LEKAHDVIEKLGFEVDPIGANLMAVRAAPAALPLSDLDETLRCSPGVSSAKAARRRIPLSSSRRPLVMAACKGAIKAHDPLTPQQVKALLERLDKARHPFSCPHGRPCVLPSAVAANRARVRASRFRLRIAPLHAQGSPGRCSR
jgi:DNA mismatch repair protein MutL